MAIPYVMVHFNKPLPETFGALGAALILGALALRAGSFIPGFFLHWAVGLTMDALAVRSMVD
jgi:membrane protease YdiL (CAAX protease family)